MRKLIIIMGFTQFSMASIYASDIEYFKNSNKIKTKTPVKHLIVLFQENVTFDRYFATYPNATNPKGEPIFTAKPNTPKVNGLTKDLIENNPNSINPYLLKRNEYIYTANHSYNALIGAVNNGKLNKFVEKTSNPDKPGENMAYYDGNTVTAIWNYAQQYSMSDNAFTLNYTPTTPGHLNLISGNTGNIISSKPTDRVLNGYMIDNLNSTLDDCSYDEDNIINTVDNPTKISGYVVDQKNIGDTLNTAKVKWGWFSGGFKPTGVNKYGKVICGKKSTSRYGITTPDYDVTTQPFQYYLSTSNPHHLPPTNIAAVGSQDQANHLYDIADFYNTINSSEDVPSVIFIKAASYQQAHPGYSDPLDEQEYLVGTINAIMKSKIWKDSALVITYDDTDGSYDHVMPPKSEFDDVKGRKGYGQRIPFIVISPYAKENFCFAFTN